ncbi:hypothetical protein BYZ73_03500 [Rhodovulum viride]|uniref:AAA domain-containing protein n=1 Tax=Rhodovulum viride TaxID=1231134 RepID=A0ABX9DMX3_9RHOB|nr:hypothetical protein BYZ73_03500 [Rhodovulum viride]
MLEAETRSGETEAAPWRFATLLAAGEVDALYFAVPTRAAAQHLLRRVNAALLRMFDPAPEAILAVPGQLLSGEAAGRPLPGFAGLWDDTTTRPARWAAEHVARCLTAQVAVGTVDRLALGGLRVKYGHLRGSARSRALVVIDEVHASDACMTEVQLAMPLALTCCWPSTGNRRSITAASQPRIARRRRWNSRSTFVPICRSPRATTT